MVRFFHARISSLRNCRTGVAHLGRPALAVALCAVTGVLLSLTQATPAAATGLSVGAGSTVRLDNAVLALGCNDLLIEPAGTLQAQASTIRLAGNWYNHGTFVPGTGTVLLEDGCGAAAIASVTGSNTFFDLAITTSAGKTVQFEVGASQTVVDSLTLNGAPGHLLAIRSSMPGQQAFLDLVPTGSQHIDFVDVADTAATGRRLAPGPAAAAHSIDSGGTPGWFFFGLSVGAGSTVQLGNATLALGCNDLQIKPAGTLKAQTSTIRLAGNWDNQGTFDPGTGKVFFEDGCGVAEVTSIAGNNTFFDLSITTSTKKRVQFAAGSTQTILDSLTLMGAPGNLLFIRSSLPGAQAFLNLVPGAAQHIDFVDVADNGATGKHLVPFPPGAIQSVDSGNNTGWFTSGAAIPAMSGAGVAALILLLLAALVHRTRKRSHRHPVGLT
jgi:hypothetical protein